MTLYKDNAGLKIKIVITATGEKEYRVNCKYIKGKYYTINKDVFEINDTWYRKESGFIEYDHELKSWVLKASTQLIKGIIGFANGKPTMGYFTENLINNAKAIYNGSKHNCIHFELLLNHGFIENVANGEYYYTEEHSATGVKKLQTIRSEGNFTHKGYNIEDNASEFELKKQIFAGYTPRISKDAKSFGMFLGDITFGAELETSEGGNIPEHLQYRNGLVACRDGSISAAEWVTIPMAGAKGLQTLNNISEALIPRANIDINCSLHLHIGNIPTDRTYIVSLYTLCYKIQDEIFKMFPYFKIDPRGIKRKNYCQKLKKLAINPCKDFSKTGFKEYVDSVYYSIFMFLSDGVPPDENNSKKRMKHPIKNKWERNSRSLNK